MSKIKPFYVSGIVYNLKSQQILLLQQKNNLVPNWSTLGGESREDEIAQVTFQRLLHELLNFDLKIKHIYPVYDYFHDILGKINYVFYAEIKKTLEFNSLKDNTSSWVTFGQSLKLLLSAHTRQDVVVCERVIRLKERQDEARELLHGI